MLKSIRRQVCSMVSVRDNEGKLKECLTFIFKVIYRDQMTYVSQFEIHNIGCFIRNWERVCITYTTLDEPRVAISYSDLDFQGLSFRSSEKLQLLQDP